MHQSRRVVEYGRAVGGMCQSGGLSMVDGRLGSEYVRVVGRVW